MFDLKSWVRPSIEEAEEMRRAALVEEERSRQIEADRRGDDRVCLLAAVNASSQTNFFTGFSENISEGGVFIATLSPPVIGTELEVNISVDDDDPVNVRGQVSWIRTDDTGHPTGCGIRFVELNSRQEQALAALVDRANREPLFYEV
jgi:uncharacterized protein (TIGR02266 family)